MLAPDENFAIVGGGCEDIAVFGVGPRDGPDCTFVSAVEVLTGRSGSELDGGRARVEIDG